MKPADEKPLATSAADKIVTSEALSNREILFLINPKALGRMNPKSRPRIESLFSRLQDRNR